MDGPSRLLLISFSCVPATDAHAAAVTATVRALNRLFENIDVVTIKGDYLAHIERFHRCRLLRVPLVGETGAERAESFRRAVQRQIDSDSYDVVHVRGPLEGIPVCNAKNEKGYRIVYEAGTFAAQDATGHMGSAEQLASVEPQLRRDELVCASRADLVIVHSDSARKALEARGVSAPAQVVPSGVNVDLFDWQESKEDTIPTILCVGDLSPWRDVPGVLEALRLVLDETPVHLRWVGEPDAKKRLLLGTYAEELGVDGAVSFEGPSDEEALPRLISTASVCIAPASPVERFVEWGDIPNGMLEHMACRRPVVAARTPGVEEIVRDGTEALFYTPGDPSGLASGILFLLRNRRQAKLLAERGYRRVRERFSASAQRRTMLGTYVELLGVAPSDDDDDEGSRPTDVDGEPPEKEGASESVDIVTAVMHTSEETSRMRVGASDTHRVKAPSEPEDAADTHPSIEMKDDPDTASGTWVLPETTPHATTLKDEETGRTKVPKVETPPPAEDTSRILQESGGGTDPEQGPEAVD